MLNRAGRRRDVNKRIFLDKFKKNTSFGELGDFLRRYSPYRLELLQRLALAKRSLKFYELYRGDSYEKSRMKKHLPTLSEARLIARKKINGVNVISMSFNGLMIYLASLNAVVNDFLDKKSEELISIFEEDLSNEKMKLAEHIRKEIERERSKMKQRKHKSIMFLLEGLLISSLDIVSEARILGLLSEASRAVLVDGLRLVDLADHIVLNHGTLLPRDLVKSWNDLKKRDIYDLRGIFLIRAAYHLPYYARPPTVLRSEKALEEHLKSRFMRLFTIESMLVDRKKFLLSKSLVPSELVSEHWTSFTVLYSSLGCEWLYAVLPSRRLSFHVLQVVKDFPEEFLHPYAAYHSTQLLLAKRVKPKGLKKIALISMLMAQLPRQSRERMKRLFEMVLRELKFKKFNF